MRWSYRQCFPLARSIGPSARCDLCRVVKGDALELLPVVRPNSLKVKWRGQCQIALSLQARGSEADSPILRVQITWNGEWEDGADEMNGLRVEVLA